MASAATVKAAADAIRADLKAAFPGTKFSVRMGTGTASAWIDVAWTDGPNEDMVQTLTDPYVDRYQVLGKPVEGVEPNRTISMPVRLQAQELIREVLPDFEVYGADGRYLSDRPDAVEVFHLGGWRFGGGGASAALRQVADLLILNPRTGPGICGHGLSADSCMGPDHWCRPDEIAQGW
jgi:hypothetical protein